MQTKTSEAKSLVDGYGPAVGDTTGYNTVVTRRGVRAVPYVRQVKAEEGLACLACLFPSAFSKSTAMLEPRRTCRHQSEKADNEWNGTIPMGDKKEF